MELFKSDGTLKKRSALIAHYTDYVVENAKTAWEEVMKVEHEALYPKQLSNPLYDATAEEPVAEFIDNAEYVEYDVWMAETIVIQEAKEAVVVDGLVIAEPSVPEIREAVRKFEAPIVTEEMLDEYLKTSKQYTNYMRTNMKVTVSSGKEFNADLLARTNMSAAVFASEVTGQTSTMWKLATNEVIEVTADELKEACILALVEFGKWTI